MVSIGIVGVTGYTGIELYKLLRGHPAARLAWLTSESYAGQRLSDVFPVPWDAPLLRVEDAPFDAVDIVFLCLPHAAAMRTAAQARAAGARVVDLSADFRLHDADSYARWYGLAHSEPALLAEAVYGLPELHRPAIAVANVVANPGCYATSVILGLAPLARNGWLRGQVIADSKSGVSGAGRKATLGNSFVEANENLSPYSIGYAHRHIAEMEQELEEVSRVRGRLSGGGRPLTPSPNPPVTLPSAHPPAFRLIFSPHLLPVSRGILSTIYVTLPDHVNEATVRAAYTDAYAHEPFVHCLPPGQVATLHHVVHSNRCAVGLTFAPNTSTLIITSAIDNLLKGASGQAVQNMNCMAGLGETTGLA